MDQIRQFIYELEPHQHAFQPNLNLDVDIKQNQTPQLYQNFNNELFLIQKGWNLSENEINMIEINPVNKQYSLYGSILSLLYDQYNYSVSYRQKHEIIDNLIRFLIAKSEIDKNIKSTIKNIGIKSQLLIDDIKNIKFQSQKVVFLLSLIFDLNIIVLTQSDIELYHNEDSYDSCKPNILLYRDIHQTYHPIIYKKKSMSIYNAQLLIYYSDPIVREIISNINVKTINQKYLNLKTKNI